jgi:AraC-like DNA-binding protein/mannose-6-phosphate isomerase-like protein (cupin superfamily)
MNNENLYKKLLKEAPIVSEILVKKFTEEGYNSCYCVYLEKVFELSQDYHVHDEYEILYVLEGKVLYNIIDKQYVLESGDMILIPMNTLHKIANPDAKTKRIVLSFSNEYISHYSTEKTNLLNVFNKIKITNIHKISFKNQLKKILETNLKQLCELFKSKEYGADILYNSKFTQTILLINNEFQSIREDYIPNEDDATISLITKYIDDNIDKKITLSDISKFTSLSISRVAHLFKEKTGITIVQYITKKRLVLAKHLLGKGIPIHHIYGECGFQDYTSFFRSFKKEYNITPKQFITSYKNINQ